MTSRLKIDGFVKSLGKGACFLRPVYTNDNGDYFLQEIDNNGKIEEFSPCQLPETLHLTPSIIPYDEQYRCVGGNALYAFYFDDFFIITGTKDELQKKLEDNIANIQNPFLKIDVLIFIGKEGTYMEAVNAAYNYLKQISTFRAKEWKKSIEQELFPSKLFSEYLERVHYLIKDEHYHDKDTIELPVLGSYFADRWPKLASSIKTLASIVYKGSKDKKILAAQLSKFINSLWDIDIFYISYNSRKELIEPLNGIARFLTGVNGGPSDGTPPVSKEIALINQSIIRAHLLVLKVKKAIGTLDLQTYLTNLPLAIAAADIVSPLGDNKHIIKDIFKETKEAVILMPKSYDKVLEDESIEDSNKFDFLLGTIDILLFRASVLLIAEKSSDDIMKSLSNVVKHFYSSIKIIEKDNVSDIQHVIIRLYHRSKFVDFMVEMMHHRIKLPSKNTSEITKANMMFQKKLQLFINNPYPIVNYSPFNFVKRNTHNDDNDSHGVPIYGNYYRRQRGYCLPLNNRWVTSGRRTTNVSQRRRLFIPLTGQTTVDELANMYEVSIDTIRRRIIRPLIKATPQRSQKRRAIKEFTGQMTVNELASMFRVNARVIMRLLHLPFRVNARVIMRLPNPLFECRSTGIAEEVKIQPPTPYRVKT